MFYRSCALGGQLVLGLSGQGNWEKLCVLVERQGQKPEKQCILHAQCFKTHMKHEAL
jgi:hypothetical protein